jgi:hypothetical protein
MYIGPQLKRGSQPLSFVSRFGIRILQWGVRIKNMVMSYVTPAPENDLSAASPPSGKRFYDLIEGGTAARRYDEPLR